jgi:hypothetical protein
MKALYAYFGLLDLHDIDSPGHSLYQIGLVDSIKETFNCEKFDFYSYYPDDVIKSAKLSGFPDTPLGRLFAGYRADLFDSPIHRIETVVEDIKSIKYSKLFLKARFRNLSTLAKKWKDARDFEIIIQTAIDSGYSKEQIVILDTDLSLPDSFFEKFSHKVTISVPSIDFPGISNRFLKECVEINLATKDYSSHVSVFYGNIDTSKYKAGNSKNAILGEVIDWIESNNDARSTLALICKASDYSGHEKTAAHVPRNDRAGIWEMLEISTLMINVTKDKYDTAQFIPARVFEAMIFGMIPVSYKFEFLCKTFSFDNLDDFIEIYKYLKECDDTGLKQAYVHFVDNYVNYVDRLHEKVIN